MKTKKILISIFKYTTLIIGALCSIVPLLVVFFSSFKTKSEYNSTGPLDLPKSFLNFDNYIKAFTQGNMIQGFINTLIILFISLTIAILIGTMVAYVLHRFEFRGKKIVMGLFLLATLIPAITTQVSTFQIINNLGLFNTRLAPIILFGGTDIIAVYIFLQFLDGISYSLDEAALLEGASYFKIYRSIILPLLKPAIATVIIIKGVAIYNDFYTCFLYMPKTELQVVSTALFRFKGPYGSQWEVICAGVVIVIIPTLIAFIALQKHIYNGLTSGSVK